MNNELPKAKDVEHHYYPLLNEYVLTRRFLFGLLPFPKDAIVHVIILGFLGVFSQFLWLNHELPLRTEENIELSKNIFYWIALVLYFIQMTMLSTWITRRRLVTICSKIEEALGQEAQAKFKDDDEDSRKAILVLVSHSRRFMITDFLISLSLFFSIITLESVISRLIFNLLNL